VIREWERIEDRKVPRSLKCSRVEGRSPRARNLLLGPVQTVEIMRLMVFLETSSTKRSAFDDPVQNVLISIRLKVAISKSMV
jgi:hypothetical protein